MKYVLFVCNKNAGRSQMAQAFFERYAPEDVCAESAGLEPIDQIHPAVVEAMAEVDIDISERQPKRLTVEMQLHADLAVTLGCGGQCPYVPTLVEDWEIPDPAGKPIAEVREIRDEIAARVDDLVFKRIEAVRSDEARECADAVLSRYDDAPIRSHIATLVCLRSERCYELDAR